ncbi:MAG: hypothetical protein IMZ71_00950 [Chloroflexi bacterium]|nr:hypothetical protein [Chloroflexota bacterium]
MDSWNGKQLSPLDENEPLKAGDRILIRFKWLLEGVWFRSYQLSFIEKKLAGRKDWRVLSFTNEQDFLIAEIEILDMPVEPSVQQAGVAPVLIVAFISATVCSLVYGLIKHDQFKLIMAGKMSPPVSSLAEVSIGFKILGYAALVGVCGWFALRILRR